MRCCATRCNGSDRRLSPTCPSGVCNLTRVLPLLPTILFSWERVCVVRRVDARAARAGPPAPAHTPPPLSGPQHPQDRSAAPPHHHTPDQPPQPTTAPRHHQASTHRRHSRHPAPAPTTPAGGGAHDRHGTFRGTSQAGTAPPEPARRSLPDSDAVSELAAAQSRRAALRSIPWVLALGTGWSSGAEGG